MGTLCIFILCSFFMTGIFLGRKSITQLTPFIIVLLTLQFTVFHLLAGVWLNFFPPAPPVLERESDHAIPTSN
jgi:hypothetical protein